MLPKQLRNPIFIGLLTIVAGSVPVTTVRAHGEEKPGPNGGEIRMPGAFHAEVRQEGREIRVYLLDLEFRNSVTEASHVEMSANRESKEAGAKHWKLKCEPSKAARPSYFSCLNPDYKPQAGDVLKVVAKRGAMLGNEVEYRLPLRK